MVSVQKKLKGTNNVLAAFTVDNGIAIGNKKCGECMVDAVVALKGDGNGNTTLFINTDKLKGLNGNVVFKSFSDGFEDNKKHRMNISECIRQKGWECSEGRIGRWSAVNVGFINSDGEDDEVQFDIRHACTKDGEAELRCLFAGFCRDNDYSPNTVQYVAVVATADTQEELDD